MVDNRLVERDNMEFECVGNMGVALNVNKFSIFNKTCKK